ncbi:hypothetical protein HNP99_003049 [Flavobacterium sp. 28A]|uniref:hypothetical protein n=1 Tax=Flavobacterium sp. 28A TaxID=2735895 RepID=UPI00156EDBA0|nr:hypothetical protein [Flavobacterium sp. 28A]NRT16677.1 hypothetical protein [Flavobacterium sp. 28A]
MNIYKKNTLFIIGLTIILFLNIFYVFLFRNSIDQPELPDSYKSYKAFRDTTTKSLNYEITKLKGSWSEKDSFEEPIFAENSDFVVLHSNLRPSSNGKSLFYKLDKNAKLVDSIPDTYFNIRNAYLINQDSYCTWLTDGNKVNKKYIDINSDTEWGTKKVQKEFKLLMNKAISIDFFYYDYLWEDHSKNHEDKIDKAIFLIDGKWYALYGKDLNLPIYLTLSTQKEELFRSKFTHTLLADYFHKTNSIGSNEIIWNGNAYFNFIKEKDTLKIFQKMEFNGEKEDLFLTYYGSKNINFYLILNEYSEGYHIIKPISNK